MTQIETRFRLLPVLGSDAEALATLRVLAMQESQNVRAGTAVLELLFAAADRVGKDIRVGALKQSGSNYFYMRHGFEFDSAEEFDNYYVRRAKPPRLPQEVECPK